MTIDFPPWLEQYKTQIDKSSMHHAYLISGREGIGKSILAEDLSLNALCHSEQRDLCGDCYSCKLDDINNHPDFHSLNVLPDKKLIGIGQIHQLRDKLYESAFLGKNKVISVSALQKITLDGLNAFLKILEEPPQNTYFFLTTDFLNSIPLTIQSRCLGIKVEQPKLRESLDWLSDFPEDESIQALKLSNFVPMVAKGFLENNFLSLREDFIDEISSIIKEGRGITSTSEKWIKEEESLNIKLEWMSQILIDSIKFNASSQIENLNSDTDNISRYLGENTKINKLHELLTQTNQLWSIFSKETNLRADYQLNCLFVDWERNLGISKKI